ncbi:FAD:protein FMN transferase [Pseudovibrio exalbescens]|uniref:FAD:protein FMN transferase n=1 Tax=Pseudovibrio exalbescens TaxID=197461 RepID=A0A1U7JCD9_9HYPH|nr:FAD:protein FMN transferase [Pseudovibrio exalbescens]OKL42368.1 thiamine biosynthesis protein ApbE [Pseudovibrio exalbescens]
MHRFALALFALLLAACSPEEATRQEIKFSGSTMGTTYHVRVIKGDNPLSGTKLQQAIDASLKEVNNSLSNWIPSSEVERFNASRSTEWLPVSKDFSDIMQSSLKLHELSGGRFDVTLAPLIDLWGFGPSEDLPPEPSAEEIHAALNAVGMATMLEFETDPPALRKVNPQTTVNLSAIAKGFGVDKIAATLEDNGFSEYLVEIGGDLYAKGLNSKGTPWVVGIEKPDPSQRVLQHVIEVEDMGMATSGDYRNYKEVDGKRLSHIIDPVTGRPISHKLASVTVLADTAALADGWATAIYAMGPDKGMELAERENLPVFMIIRAQGGFSEQASSAFSKLEARPNQPQG